MVIANGRDAASARGARARARAAPGSWPAPTPAAARKRWIAGALKPRGTLTIDAGARSALKPGKSLLPAGVRQVDGSFERGDAVIVPRRRRQRARPRARSPMPRRRRAHRSAAQPCEIESHPRLSWPRRDDPPRRSGADHGRIMALDSMARRAARDRPFADRDAGDRPRARARPPRALALASTAGQERARSPPPRADLRAQRRADPRRQCRGHRSGAQGAADLGALLDRLTLDDGAHRGDGARARGRSPRCPIRSGAVTGALDAAQRPRHRARAHAASASSA